MSSALPRRLDPLDKEILERALEGAFLVLKDRAAKGLNNDDALEAVLRRELNQIARLNGFGDVDTLRDVLLDKLSVADTNVANPIS